MRLLEGGYRFCWANASGDNDFWAHRWDISSKLQKFLIYYYYFFFSVWSQLLFLLLTWMLDCGMCFWHLLMMINSGDALPWSTGIMIMILANWKSGLVNKSNYSEKGQAQTLVCANNLFASLQYVWGTSSPSDSWQAASGHRIEKEKYKCLHNQHKTWKMLSHTAHACWSEKSGRWLRQGVPHQGACWESSSMKRVNTRTPLDVKSLGARWPWGHLSLERWPWRCLDLETCTVECKNWLFSSPCLLTSPSSFLAPCFCTNKIRTNGNQNTLGDHEQLW